MCVCVCVCVLYLYICLDVCLGVVLTNIYMVSQVGLQTKITSFAHAVMTADWALKAYKYTTMEADDMKKLAKNPLDALNKSNNRILKCLVIMCIESRLVLY